MRGRIGVFSRKFWKIVITFNPEPCLNYTSQFTNFQTVIADEKLQAKSEAVYFCNVCVKKQFITIAEKRSMQVVTLWQGN